MALSRIDTTNMIEDVPQSKLDNNVNFRNIIINGDMSIAQRGTSATGLTNGNSGYHTCDRWKFSEGGAPSFQFTQTQSTDVPTGQGFATSLKMDCTTAQGSLAAADNLRIDQRVEGQNLQYLKKGTSSAESLTISFWVKSNKTGTYIVELLDNDNTRTINKSYTISSTNTWEKKTITYDGDTSGAFDNDNAQSFRCNFFLAAGTDLTSGSLQTSWGSLTTANRAVGQVNLADSTDNEWYITGVQLEAGDTASDFEFLPHDVNLERCQRYFWKSYEIGDAPGSAPKLNSVIARFVDATTSYGSIQVPYVNLRANPTKTIYSPQSGATGKLISDNLVDINANSESISSHGGGWIYAGAVSISGGTSCRAHLTLDAEL
jgi:hypothetical protein